MDIKYTIEFHTDWHCGSGLAAGADVDALVVKDSMGLPYIPGKTIKGLLREAIEEIRGFQKKGCDDSFIKTFGYFDSKEDMAKGDTFFSNAELSQEEKDAILNQQLVRFMYRQIANTAIGKDGIAVGHSLRQIETVVPCTLGGQILNIPDSMKDEMTSALRYIKRLGQGRNRGLGRCTITITEQ